MKRKLLLAASVGILLFEVPVLGKDSEIDLKSTEPANATDDAIRPFGIVKGQSVGSLKAIAVEPTTYYEIPNPTVSNQTFRHVGVQATKETGVCMVLAHSDDFIGDVSGNRVRIEYDFYKEGLVAKYGAPKQSNEWENDLSRKENWTSDLIKRHAHHSTIWMLDRDDWVRIELRVLAFERERPFLALTYVFSNKGTCEEIARQAKVKGL